MKPFDSHSTFESAEEQLLEAYINFLVLNLESFECLINFKFVCLSESS